MVSATFDTPDQAGLVMFAVPPRRDPASRDSLLKVQMAFRTSLPPIDSPSHRPFGTSTWTTRARTPRPFVQLMQTAAWPGLLPPLSGLDGFVAAFFPPFLLSPSRRCAAARAGGDSMATGSQSNASSKCKIWCPDCPHFARLQASPLLRPLSPCRDPRDAVEGRRDDGMRLTRRAFLA